MNDAIVDAPAPGAGFTSEQKEYLAGLFAGVAARAQPAADAIPAPASKNEDLICEERLKRELHPLDAYSQIVENAMGNQPPDKDEVFRFKWHGLFFLAPVAGAFMARLRIPGGVVRSHQLRELARVALELTTGQVQITTRANFQLRLIQPKDAPEVLRRIQNAGLHTRGAGADNVRNLTANPTAGLDPVELINVLPLIEELGQVILNDRSFYDLPRKFNIAYDGGGLIGPVEDTNDIGVKAVKCGEEILFRIALGGATGHRVFGRDLGVVVPPARINQVVIAALRVYLEHGCRSDRKKARLKHLLEHLPVEAYRAEMEKKLGGPLRRLAPEATPFRWAAQELAHSHLGDFPQKQPGLNYVGAAVPVGQITPRQLLRVADLADSYGSGEIRLTIWQNFIVPNVPDAFVPAIKRALERMGLPARASAISGGVVACTGNTFCKYAQANTKGHARELIKHLESRLELDQPLNIHLTGCPHSCAQHYIGDIGCLGTKVRGEDGYHVFVGGGFGKNQALGRRIFTGVSARSLPTVLETMLRGYLKHRAGKESFQQFTGRHELRTLQELLGGGGRSTGS